MNGVAVLMVMAMLPHLLGLPAGQGAADWRNAQPLAPVVALTALVLAVRPPRWTRRVPAYLTGLLAATALHHLLALTPLAGALGPLFDAPRFEWPGIDAWRRYLIGLAMVCCATSYGCCFSSPLRPRSSRACRPRWRAPPSMN